MKSCEIFFAFKRSERRCWRARVFPSTWSFPGCAGSFLSSALYDFDFFSSALSHNNSLTVRRRCWTRTEYEANELETNVAREATVKHEQSSAENRMQTECRVAHEVLLALLLLLATDAADCRLVFLRSFWGARTVKQRSQQMVWGQVELKDAHKITLLLTITITCCNYATYNFSTVPTNNISEIFPTL